MKFNKVYKTPFHSEGPFILTADNVIALYHCSEEPGNQECETITNVLNGTAKAMYSDLSIRGKSPDLVISNNSTFLEVRGWEYLIDHCGLSLKKAVKLQESFAESVVVKLTRG